MGYYSGKLMGMQAEAVSGIVTDGLQLYLDASNPASYPGSGTTWYDLSGNSNNGTMIGGVTQGSDNGGVMIFDGVNDYIDLGVGSQTNTDYMTIQAFINPTLLTDVKIIARDDPTGGSVNRCYAFGINNSKIAIEIWNTSNQYCVLYGAEMTTTLNINTWYFITTTFDGNTLKAYVNSTIDGQTNMTGVIKKASTNTLIGRRGDYWQLWYKGKIGLISYYNKALSSVEIAQNFNALKSRYGL